MNIMKCSGNFIFILCTCLLSGCFGGKNRPSSDKTTSALKASTIYGESTNNTQEKKPEKNSLSDKIEKKVSISEDTTKSIPTITVWVHGTRLITKFAPQEFLFSPDGMKAISEIPDRYHMHKIAKNLSEMNPQRFQVENFYLFGWSGKLSFEERKKASEDLYNELSDLSDNYYEQQGVRPHFRIITHSHGGNVALNLAGIQDKKIPVISELILLACPVQERTKDFIKDPFFKRVYSFFSRGELLQVIDPQGLYRGNKNQPLFSKRVFPDNPKLSQAEIKLYGRSILHIEFLFGYFVYKLPAMLDALDKEHAAQVKAKKFNETDGDYVIIDIKKKQSTKKRKNRKHKTLVI